MIPVMQTKVVVKKSNGEQVVYGNCYAAAIASLIELSIDQVPNVEIFFPLSDTYWIEVMDKFLRFKGYEINTDKRFENFHNCVIQNGLNNAIYLSDCYDKYYLISGKSIRGNYHICIYKNGEMIHDPHPAKEGLQTFEVFQTLTKMPTPTK